MGMTLPDITSSENVASAAPLKWVGMEGITVPIQVPMSGEVPAYVNAKTDVYVSLDKSDAKGIHMSRLFLKLNDILGTELLSSTSLTALLNELILSQQGLSQGAKVNLDFALTLRKKALLSNEFGYQSYPIGISTQLVKGVARTVLSLTIAYSSTCPCSSALAQQALSDAISQRFDDEMISKSELTQWITSKTGAVATPHSQRSYAYIKLTLDGDALPNLPELITLLETTIGTPVQTAVKRQDEQAFAKLNAENLMFCEDAARRLKRALERKENVLDYWFKVEHQESLHAHNAVAIDFKDNADEDTM
ncbi:GTP cyclohydrolase I [Paraglaciecola sp. T6c]|uniref:GTP cyclohydrolase FolE2 n=1 Tax=Pseudoalteromonas atlantica (strain T6c / ATCC BAA-1087) TaxID=3042615 RepID=GCH4_PSEA6|nr:GTP cyclohydrolase FolE2 [Paraglaciecola sp. T6c]Q15Z55.1 RecName: Full=GTP cyclohydrolase FolE2 [Paraglaciecola sp. T6c]ABG38833.1 GTP cyclohydrolase I [Paraglaciecola sp. T6c]